MNEWIGWLSAVVLAGVVGVVSGSIAGATGERGKIASDCRVGGSFVVKRTAFDCKVRK